MHVQIVTFNLNGISEQEYLDVANEVADRFSALPGLQAKLWLEHAPSNTYGGIYFWDDRESMERFLRSELFEGTNPEFSNVVAEDYGVLENLTRATQPVLEILEEAVTARARPRVSATPPTKAAGAKKTPRATKAARAKAAAPKKTARATGASRKAVKAPGAKAPAKRGTAARGRKL